MDYIREKISSHPVTLFMKGTADQPYCGFSKGLVDILKKLNVSFQAFDVLEDPQLRADLKVFSQWPTFPQLYVRGEFIGGFDIVREMYLSQEILPLLEPYVQSI